MKRTSCEVTQRQLRVGEELRHALSEVFGRGILRNPDVADRSITVTEVRPSPDLKSAMVFVMPLGGENTDTLLTALKRTAPFLTSEVCKRVHLKFAPRLNFELDRSFDRVDQIETLLRSPEVSRDLRSEDVDEAGTASDQDSEAV